METNRQNELHPFVQEANRSPFHLSTRRALHKMAVSAGSVDPISSTAQSGDVGMQRTGFRAFATIDMALDRIEPACELLIYRLDGRLSVIFITEYRSVFEAIQKAAEIARYGYRVEVWRNGAEVRLGPIPAKSAQVL
jgi:hypothetical protein